MSKLQTVVGVALLIVLTFIAFDLHRLANMFAGPVIGRRAAVVWPTRPTETREERNKRLQKDQQQNELDFEAILDTPDPHKKPIK